MSAWIATDKHIASVVCAAIAEARQQEVADLIKKANIRSVNHRYDEDTEITPCDLNEAEALRPSEVVKLAHSLDYQSCERDDYRGSEAERWIHQIVFDASGDMFVEGDRWSM